MSHFRDVSSVELLMNNHQGIKAEIDARNDSFTTCIELGKSLLARKHYASEEVGCHLALGPRGEGSCVKMLNDCMLCVYICVCVCIHTHTQKYIFTFIYTYAHTYIYISKLLAFFPVCIKKDKYLDSGHRASKCVAQQTIFEDPELRFRPLSPSSVLFLGDTPSSLSHVPWICLFFSGCCYLHLVRW